MILFVDDEPKYIDIYVEELRESGEIVEFKSDVDSALYFFQENYQDIDLLILDIMMPAGKEFIDFDADQGAQTGFHFYEKIKKIDPSHPVIILTNVLNEELATKICGKDENCLILQKSEIFPLDLVDEVKNILEPN